MGGVIFGNKNHETKLALALFSDVAFNAEFKKNVDRLGTEHLSANPELFMSGKEYALVIGVCFSQNGWARRGKRPRVG